MLVLMFSILKRTNTNEEICELVLDWASGKAKTKATILLQFRRDMIEGRKNSMHKSRAM